jgi:hypothetical protein
VLDAQDEVRLVEVRDGMADSISKVEPGRRPIARVRISTRL